jgi:hypothetical protein
MIEKGAVSEHMNNQSAKAISLAEAVELFNEIADLPYVYEHFQEGCYARAHLICAYMKSKGFDALKAWEIEDRYNKLKVERDGQEASWWYHVAAAIRVRFPDGEVKPVVFDPAIFDGPVTTAQWASNMGGFKEKVQVVDYMSPPSGYPGNYKPNFFIPTDEDISLRSRKTLKDMAVYQRAEPRRVFPSALMREYYPHQEIRAGHSWKTDKITLPVVGV